jgi:hypothetical protein
MTLDIVNTFGRIIVPAAVIAVLSLLRRYLPARKTRPQSAAAPRRDPEDFSGTQWTVGISMLVVGLAFGFLVHKALVMANHHFAAADGPAAFRLLPSSAIWWFFPGFGALCLTWEITLLLWSVFEDREKIVRYVAWSDERTGFDSTRAFRWMAVLLALPIGLATVLAIPVHSTLRDRDIVVGHYATLAQQVLPYSQARRLVLVGGFRDRSGKFSPRAGMIIDFSDGSRWSSSANRDFKPEVDFGLTEFLQLKTGLPVEYAETEADLRKQTG